ncbi:MAG TPA: hypothetical protein VGM24_02145, partial [Puia sp.]
EITVNEPYEYAPESGPVANDPPSTINEEYREPEITVNEQYEAVPESGPVADYPPSTINEEYREPEITVNEQYEAAPESGPVAEHAPSTINEEYREPEITINEQYEEALEAYPIVNQELAGYTEPEAPVAPAAPDFEAEAIPSSADSPALPPFDAKKAESIVFAPYHMIDYFASQGIKLVLEDQPSDSFGKQLKSFTDWLKVMKRLPGQRFVPEKADERESERIRHFAADSLEERDILTETMAEVLAKQGMYENAIALYQKLSLIYPPKSVYFASRIEQLKASLS